MIMRHQIGSTNGLGAHTTPDNTQALVICFHYQDYVCWCDLRRLESTCGRGARFLTAGADDARWEKFRAAWNEHVTARPEQSYSGLASSQTATNPESAMAAFRRRSRAPSLGTPSAQTPRPYLPEWKEAAWLGDQNASAIYWQPPDQL
ncbi:unnamed protein product [Protopolystoma xenopodis]|uniref:Uncharacterized protein n=1 Tax=Protopolystoma xenopodis TaxID=117903 RepID=A0A448XF58_9PLAT|nr:unnamed protein product [Protopolystoma xenopodis]